jgi:hypothetical protein
MFSFRDGWNITSDDFDIKKHEEGSLREHYPLPNNSNTPNRQINKSARLPAG